MAKQHTTSNIGTLLGSTKPAGTMLLVLFVPNRDRAGQKIDHERWVTRSLDTFAQLFGGATAYPQAQGVWRDDERNVLVHEEPTILTCYADPKLVTTEALMTLRIFLHRMGREAKQGRLGLSLTVSSYASQNLIVVVNIE